ncbi:unnamed protein product [Paramecium primaurelia]|uniref:Uncharacterized protein n=1 Tax=Paramecium primaurelia TaxID=5886 RepID=A0A8S1MUC5_PARPR|nr:unnamed protein product [Paramecium primaurelia]
MKSFKDQTNKTNAIIKVILKRNFLERFHNHKMLLSRLYKIFEADYLNALRVKFDKLFNSQYNSIFNSH